jgi:small subunit ribosomal protein S3
MGQKTHPRGLRTGILYGWESKWFSTRDAARHIGEDLRVRAFVKSKLVSAGISRVEVERAGERVKVNIFAAKPGLVIGKKGKDIEHLKKELCELVKRSKEKVALNIVESRKSEMDAQLLAEGIAFSLERRVNFRRAMKDAVGKAMRSGAEGVKVVVGGRLNGADIARSESQKEGRIPLHTLRADIEYGTAEAKTTYGIIGVKTWVFKGERFSQREQGGIEALQL